MLTPLTMLTLLTPLTLLSLLTLLTPLTPLTPLTLLTLLRLLAKQQSRGAFEAFDSSVSCFNSLSAAHLPRSAALSRGDAGREAKKREAPELHANPGANSNYPRDGTPSYRRAKTAHSGHGPRGKNSESEGKLKRTRDSAANLCALKKGGCKMALGAWG